MKAIAKHDCKVTLYVDPNALSFNRIAVKKGEEITGKVMRDDSPKSEKIRKVLGDRNVRFLLPDGIWQTTCYSKDFEFIEE